MTKKKWLSVLLAVVLVAALLPTMAWADTATSKPWTTGDGYGTAEDAGNGWYVLKGDDTYPNMMTGPFASFSYLSDDESFNIGAGFVMSVKLDTTAVAEGEDFAWSFGISENLDDPEAYNYLNEIAFHFSGVAGGKAKLMQLQSNVDSSEGHSAEDGIQSVSFTPVLSDDGIYDLKAEFTPRHK